MQACTRVRADKPMRADKLVQTIGCVWTNGCVQKNGCVWTNVDPTLSTAVNGPNVNLNSWFTTQHSGKRSEREYDWFLHHVARPLTHILQQQVCMHPKLGATSVQTPGHWSRRTFMHAIFPRLTVKMRI